MPYKQLCNKVLILLQVVYEIPESQYCDTDQHQIAKTMEHIFPISYSSILNIIADTETGIQLLLQLVMKYIPIHHCHVLFLSILQISISSTLPTTGALLYFLPHPVYVGVLQYETSFV